MLGDKILLGDFMLLGDVHPRLHGPTPLWTVTLTPVSVKKLLVKESNISNVIKNKMLVTRVYHGNTHV